MAEIFRNGTTALVRPEAGTVVSRTGDMDWQDTGTEGFLIKPLFEDGGSAQRTWLMKVAPGAEAPPHAHDETEQIYVIDGTFHDDENSYGPGDFAIRAAGTMHTGGSRDGATVLLIYG